jgi:type IV secretory pathway VirB2 component (pilin)
MTERKRAGVVWLVVAGVLILAPETASANILDNFGTAMLNVLNNNFLRAVATIAVIGAGIMALSGRIQWMIFITVLLAVVVIFGASGIVQYIQDNAAVSALMAPGIFAHVV